MNLGCVGRLTVPSRAPCGPVRCSTSPSPSPVHMGHFECAGQNENLRHEWQPDSSATQSHATLQLCFNGDDGFQSCACETSHRRCIIIKVTPCNGVPKRSIRHVLSELSLRATYGWEFPMCLCRDQVISTRACMHSGCIC
jgi:hypothetical protein